MPVSPFLSGNALHEGFLNHLYEHRFTALALCDEERDVVALTACLFAFANLIGCYLGTLHFQKKQYIYQYTRISCVMRRNSHGEEAAVLNGNTDSVQLHHDFRCFGSNNISK